jgi:hypothetical protein
LITDVEIQKIRQDKINPAYSPAQSEPESPGEFNFCLKRSVKNHQKNQQGGKCEEKEFKSSSGIANFFIERGLKIEITKSEAKVNKLLCLSF